MSMIRYRNVRTEQVVDLEQGCEDERRLAGLSDIWQPLTDTATGAVPPTPVAGAAVDAASVDADPSRPVPPAVKSPRPSAPVGAWREYAISRGADPAAVAAAPKTALVALYG
jgi:hypothetical protein